MPGSMEIIQAVYVLRGKALVFSATAGIEKSKIKAGYPDLGE
jgi:hypothetical protein